jgi:hypothetical protein
MNEAALSHGFIPVANRLILLSGLSVGSYVIRMADGLKMEMQSGVGNRNLLKFAIYSVAACARIYWAKDQNDT